jgi:hypothetical protein
MFVEFIIDSPQAAWFRQKAKELIAEGIDEESEKQKVERIKKEAEKLARNFIKKLLGRIVFLYFLQKKGWLGVPKNGSWGDGQHDFVGNLYKNFESKKDFYAECLVPLFFNTLNKQRTNDIFAITKTKIPYLNGGLFDKDPSEPDDTRFKAKLFEDLFAFFDSYNFTIDENSPEDQDIGIDPEMLGRIFENLIEENRERGTFYTPKDVVHYMCKEALRCYIREKLAANATLQELKAIDAFIYELPDYNSHIIKKHALAIDTALSAVKICDPAIGSGAFPMGMVYEILRLKKELFGHIPLKKGFNYSQEKLSIIKNSIYGVDVDQGAIDIARLRFWLSLIVDEDEPHPLPNLDFKIMQGDSLREWYEGIPLHNLATEEDQPLFIEEPTLELGDEFTDPQKKLVLSTKQKLELKNLVNAYFSAENQDEKRNLHRQIDGIVDRHLKANIELEKKLCLQKVDNGHRLTAKQLQLEKKNLEEIEGKEKFLIQLEKAVEKPFFLWNLFFGDALVENKGFDIVIGNPPYGVKIDDKTEEFYCLSSKDSYGAFMSLGLKRLLKVNGTLCFIVSDTWLTIKSHLPLRKQILEYQLQKVLRLHQDCFHATVNSCIVTVRKEWFNNDRLNSVIAADYTNISTRKEMGKFREKLLRVEELVGESTVEYGVYEYGQELLFKNDKLPIFAATPIVFAVMVNINCQKRKDSVGDKIKKEVDVRAVDLNGKTIEVIRFGDIADSPHGISTGDNKKYVRVLSGTKGSYPILEDGMICSRKAIEGMTAEEKVKGLNINWKNLHKCFVPFEKGGESKTEDGWLPNYYVPTRYYINWGNGALRDMRKNPGFAWKNERFFFKDGLTFSISGIYAPTFRINSKGIFEAKGSGIFSDYLSKQRMLAILCSKLAKYVFKNFIKHTVDTSGDDIAEFPFIINYTDKLSELVDSIIERQKSQQYYDYLGHEQKSIDHLVYQLYNLSASDINEVETWFARRYPKLARYADIKSPEDLKPKISTIDEKTAKYKALIATGESRTVEFKQTLRCDVKTKQINKDLEWACIKNIAAFLNSQGGTLFIGVRDEDGAIIGLDDDFNSFSDGNKQDAFLRHFDNIIAANFGNAVHHNLAINIVPLDGKAVCVVSVNSCASGPIILINKQKNGQEEFYVRRSASTVHLTLRESHQYWMEHWKQPVQAE